MQTFRPGWQKIVTEPLPFRRVITQSRWPKFRSFEHPTIQEQQCQVVLYTDAATKKFASSWIDDEKEKVGVVERLLYIAKVVKESERGFAQPKHPENRKGILDEFRHIT